MRFVNVEQKTATAFAFTTWYSTLWTRIAIPSFVSQVMGGMKFHANASLPYECFGFIVRKGGAVYTIPMPITASSNHFYVDPNVLAQTLYGFDHAAVSILSTYHSHPGGTETLTDADLPLTSWSPTHVLIARTITDWTLHVFKWGA
ncbi:Mov34/MPN/PAD-1 family protein [Alicyclobacillus dauci]|uniref:Mov34/MPN/PAD-1 family protein n=1 Tax=Alicyclobacillus dauci TaxID=1475485 RepID=A0ABY6Z8T1_9BACL|nr:Mov34/MPN/PAD-1 family protein [Alicyclobacillus dauci]WAH38977.1 Mov34/MPN/PAD-1 family protein [Alicyclobacillus dauci]